MVNPHRFLQKTSSKRDGTTRERSEISRRMVGLSVFLTSVSRIINTQIREGRGIQQVWPDGSLYEG